MFLSFFQVRDPCFFLLFKLFFGRKETGFFGRRRSFFTDKKTNTKEFVFLRKFLFDLQKPGVALVSIAALIF